MICVKNQGSSQLMDYQEFLDAGRHNKHLFVQKILN